MRNCLQEQHNLTLAIPLRKMPLPQNTLNFHPSGRGGLHEFFPVRMDSVSNITSYEGSGIGPLELNPSSVIGSFLLLRLIIQPFCASVSVCVE